MSLILYNKKSKDLSYFRKCICLYGLLDLINLGFLILHSYGCHANLVLIEQKGMTFDHDFGYSFPLSSSLLKKERRRKGE